MVASRQRVAPGTSVVRPVLIPFIAGQWSLPEAEARAKREADLVLIPFIAGQWSLPPHGGGARRMSMIVLIPFIAGQWSLP